MDEQDRSDVCMLLGDALSDAEDARSLTNQAMDRDDAATYRKAARRAQEASDELRAVAEWARAKSDGHKARQRIAQIKNKLTPAFQLVGGLDAEITPSADDVRDSFQGLKEAVDILGELFDDLEGP